MYRGIATLSVDAKGRMAIPAKHRDALVERGSGRLVLTADLDKNLMLFALPDWEVVEQRVMALPSMDRDSRRMQRLLVGYATEMELDSANRILIPQMLRDHASIEKKAIFLGQGSRFEVWDEGVWNAETENWADKGPPSESTLEQLNNFSI